MRLHEDTEIFSELVQLTAEAVGLPQIYIEKDYWVTRALKQLSESAHAHEVVFKGGTSLSKAYRLIARFSEDIDLAIFARDLSDAKRKNLLKSVTAAATSGLIELDGDPRVSKGSRYRKTVYQYPLCVDGSDSGFGQATPELVIEVNAFTQPEPFESKRIQSLIAETLSEQGRTDLITQFALECFSINVLSVKRTLVEKLLGIIKDSYDENALRLLTLRIRHIYDICLILRQHEYRTFVQSAEFSTLCNICMDDEKQIFPGTVEYLKHPLANAPLFAEFTNWRQTLEKVYKGDFSHLVFGDRPEMDEIGDTLNFLHVTIIGTDENDVVR